MRMTWRFAERLEIQRRRGVAEAVGLDAGSVRRNSDGEAADLRDRSRRRVL